ncbi:hypothetical protein [Sphingopyxis yananensis]|uniref:hypothetical protein n=1 Tax=Sphingopyxis yananensis TaxID=2886687 RepID=UPI001D0FFE8E|nr:hypothetical protein [Sphingopyxis yananensis]MCC2603387.1 hypothetical protein [Sphingopyxis yananensis]
MAAHSLQAYRLMGGAEKGVVAKWGAAPFFVGQLLSAAFIGVRYGAGVMQIFRPFWTE